MERRIGPCQRAICRERCTLCTVRGGRTMYTLTIPELTAFLTGRLLKFYSDLTLGSGVAAGAYLHSSTSQLNLSCF